MLIPANKFDKLGNIDATNLTFENLISQMQNALGCNDLRTVFTRAEVLTFIVQLVGKNNNMELQLSLYDDINVYYGFDFNKVVVCRFAQKEKHNYNKTTKEYTYKGYTISKNTDFQYEIKGFLEVYDRLTEVKAAVDNLVGFLSYCNWKVGDVIKSDNDYFHFDTDSEYVIIKEIIIDDAYAKIGYEDASKELKLKNDIEALETAVERLEKMLTLHELNVKDFICYNGADPLKRMILDEIAGFKQVIKIAKEELSKTQIASAN